MIIKILLFEWVTFDEFSLRPRLTFDQISMRLSQQEEAGLIKFKAAEIEINLMGSLIARSPRFHSIKIDGSKILITNSPTDGFLFNQIPIKKLLNVPELATKQAALDFKKYKYGTTIGRNNNFFFQSKWTD